MRKPEYVPTSEATRITGRSANTLYRWQAEGLLRIGRRVSDDKRMWRKADLLRAVELKQQNKGGNLSGVPGPGRGRKGDRLDSGNAECGYPLFEL